MPQTDALRRFLRGCIQDIEPVSQQSALPLFKIFHGHSAFLLWDV